MPRKNWNTAALHALLVSALFGSLGVVSAFADDAGESRLTDEVLQKIESDLMKRYGKDMTLGEGPAKFFGFAKAGDAVMLRQLSANNDGDPIHVHYFNRIKDRPSVILLFSQDKSMNVIRGYLTDNEFHFISGYLSKVGPLSPLTPDVGAAELRAELSWWNNMISATIWSDKGADASAKGDYEEAIADAEKSIQIDPNEEDPYQVLAWIWATCPDAKLRDGRKAIEYATKAVQFHTGTVPRDVDTLAAACAEAGNFDDAVKWETQYLQTPKLGEKDAAAASKRLELYKAHQAYHTDK